MIAITIKNTSRKCRRKLPTYSMVNRQRTQHLTLHYKMFKQQTHTIFKKLYSSILRFCGDDFGWCSFLPTDCIEPYDHNIKTGFYYIETNNVFPCHGNGWYADIFICDALNLQLITHDDMKYQIKSSRMLNPRFFEDFVKCCCSIFQQIQTSK